jgi:hypothetical protein
VPRSKEGKDRFRTANPRHEEETLEAKVDCGAKGVTFRYLKDIGNHFSMFYKQVKTRGRAPPEYEHLDLSDPEQLALGILKITI